MARVIERAKTGKLVDGSGATCSELERIINVDKKAIKLVVNAALVVLMVVFLVAGGDAGVCTGCGGGIGGRQQDGIRA